MASYPWMKNETRFIQADISLSRGQHFEVREGPRTVGLGVVTREVFTEAGSEETAHLLRSPQNAERLLQALSGSEQGEGIPLTIEELRAEIGFEEVETTNEEERA